MNLKELFVVEGMVFSWLIVHEMSEHLGPGIKLISKSAYLISMSPPPTHPPIKLPVVVFPKERLGHFAICMFLIALTLRYFK